MINRLGFLRAGNRHSPIWRCGIALGTSHVPEERSSSSGSALAKTFIFGLSLSQFAHVCNGVDQTSLEDP